MFRALSFHYWWVFVFSVVCESFSPTTAVFNGHKESLIALHSCWKAYVYVTNCILNLLNVRWDDSQLVCTGFSVHPAYRLLWSLLGSRAQELLRSFAEKWWAFWSISAPASSLLMTPARARLLHSSAVQQTPLPITLLCCGLDGARTSTEHFELLWESEVKHRRLLGSSIGRIKEFFHRIDSEGVLFSYK